MSIKDQVSTEEWKVRQDLAACYRLVAHYDWDDLIFTHISVRVPGDEAHFLLNPYGLLFEEVTASNLVKIDIHGNKVMDSDYDVNPAGFTIHSAVHEAREDAHCVLHLHTTEGVAISAQETGLLPLSQFSLFPLSGLSYHPYEGVALNPDEKKRLVSDLGTTNFMILQSHGLLTCAHTVCDAFLYMYILQRACESQIMAQAGGGKLIQVPDMIVQGMKAQAERVLQGAGGLLAWPALLRKLDRIDPSYKD
jgi:ribulose-5-phosphate 4-epimerase/fuculose-1-phosphate aldolase